MLCFFLFIDLLAAGLSCRIFNLCCSMSSAQHAESSSPDQDLKPGLLQWECRGLATGPPGSLKLL